MRNPRNQRPSRYPPRRYRGTPPGRGTAPIPSWEGWPKAGVGSAPPRGGNGRRRFPLLLLLPLLVFLNGLGPYLGLKLRSAWQMYSNLSIDDAGSNHFVVPRSLDVGGFLADSVVIVSTSDRLLKKQYVETGNRMPFFALRSYLAERPEVRLAYVRAGRYRELGRAGDSPEFSTRPNPLLRKLLTFRPLGPQAGKICDW